ncbi:MAG: serine/threonine protein kinase, partial [Deltaproteobacteria bacterium]|nr:serine/threonine protein kinase [Deltaproteobacteria bacterium]
MSTRICPECDARISLEVCPTCGIKTLMERRTEARKDPLLGRTLDGRYRIESIIGRGGMGAVYRGLQLATGQVVAIKVVRAEAAEDLDAAKRFHREARAASLLTHPHTIRVFDFGQSEDGDLYMVLEHLTGRTLGKARKAEGRFPEARIVRIAGEVCQSLMEAHAVNLAHRDMKPDNVMLLDTPGHPDFVKVLDFGIAKFLSGSSGESQVTRTGAVVGTPHYMSPEQAQGVRLLTPAIDVYALGVIVHEAVAGTKPFDGDSAFEILMSHARNPIPELPPDCAVTPALRTLVRRMLAKDPAARPGP